MEQIPAENKKPRSERSKLNLDLDKMSPQERRETFIKLLGLPENANEAEMTEFLNREHQEFSLEDFKKKEGPVGAETEKQQLEKLGRELEAMGKEMEKNVAQSVHSEDGAALTQPHETNLVAARPEFSPWQIESASDLRVGKKYRLHNQKLGTFQDIIVAAVPYSKGSGFYVRIKDPSTGSIEEKSCQDIGVTPYYEAGKALAWNPDTWVEPLELSKF